MSTPPGQQGQSDREPDGSSVPDEHDQNSTGDQPNPYSPGPYQPGRYDAGGAQPGQDQPGADQPGQDPAAGYEPGGYEPGRYPDPSGQPQYGQAPAQPEQQQYGQQPYGEAPQYGQPQYGQQPYGQAPQYGQQPYDPAQQPYNQPQQPYGQPQYGQPADAPPYGQPPPYAQQPGSGAYGAQYPAYNPYAAGAAPADKAADVEPVGRPPGMYVGLVLLVLSVVPYLFGGIVLLAQAGRINEAIDPDDLAELQRVGVDLTSMARGIAVVCLVLALVHLILSVFTFLGRSGARIALSVLTGLFALVVLGSMGALFAVASQQGVAVSGALDGASMLVVFGPVVLAIIGVVLMFVAGANRFFASRRR